MSDAPPISTTHAHGGDPDLGVSLVPPGGLLLWIVVAPMARYVSRVPAP